MICPVCQLELGVERRAGELVVTYRFGDWRQQCPCPDNPVMCSNLLPTILNRCSESSPEKPEFVAIADAVDAYEQKRWPDSKAPGGKG